MLGTDWNDILPTNCMMCGNSLINSVNKHAFHYAKLKGYYTCICTMCFYRHRHKGDSSVHFIDGMKISDTKD